MQLEKKYLINLNNNLHMSKKIIFFNFVNHCMILPSFEEMFSNIIIFFDICKLLFKLVKYFFSSYT